MTTVIKLSPATKKLIGQLRNVKSSPGVMLPEVFNVGVPDSIKLTEEFRTWLNKKQKVDNKTNFLLASLYAALLKDIHKALLTHQKKKEEKKPTSWPAKLKYLLLAAAGTIFFGCEGFDGITAILSVFSLPPIIIFIVGIIFSILSVLVFYDFDLMEISKNLGIKTTSAPKILDIYLKEVRAIKAIRKELNNTHNGHTSSKKYEEDLTLIKLLIDRYSALDDARKELAKLQDRAILKAAKNAMAGLAGIIFFSGGFFAGQTVVLAIATLFAAPVATTFWPVIIASIVVGAAAFSVYWYVGRPSMENLVARLAGLDKEKIEDFCGDKATAEKRKLDLLEKNITLAGELRIALATTQQELLIKDKELSSLKGTPYMPHVPLGDFLLKPILVPLAKPSMADRNVFCLPRSKSLTDLTGIELEKLPTVKNPYRFYFPLPTAIDTSEKTSQLGREKQF